MTCTVDHAYHDAELKEIDSSDPASLVLSFRMPDGHKKVMRLSGCEFFRISDFVPQNVVSRLMVFHGHDIDTDIVMEKLQWATSLSDASSFLDKEKMDAIVTKIQRGERSLLVLEPSWGAELAALFAERSEA